MTDKPFAEAIRCGCGKLRVGSMRVSAEYGDQAEATATRIQSDHAALVAAARKEERERIARFIETHEVSLGHHEDGSFAKMVPVKDLDCTSRRCRAAAIRALGE